MFKDVWQGNYGLGVTYWLWGVLGTLFFQLTVGLILYFTGLFTSLGLNLISLPWLIFVYVGIWRSASNQPNPNVWGILAKIMVVLGFIQFIYAVTHPFELRN